MREALDPASPSISPEELAGLACEPGVESRLVLESCGQYPWELCHGPFEAERFATLPDEGWSLLVQEVNRWVPALAELFERFRFIPNWRLDDLMVSYAPPGASVGAHIDAYDVFLIQLAGKRRWEIETTPRGTDSLDEGEGDLLQLADFAPTQSWDLEAGDMLYLPPHLAHHGIALEPSLTASVGFRAPSNAELLDAWHATAPAGNPGLRFRDAARPATRDPGKIDAATRNTLRRWLRESVEDDDALDRWIGAFLTRSRVGEESESAFVYDGGLTEALAARLAEGPLQRSNPREFAYCEKRSGGLTLFLAGETCELDDDELSRRFVQTLCGTEPLNRENLQSALQHPALRDVLYAALSRGLLF